MSKTPKLRFKEFSGEWESKRLIDICDKSDRYSFTGGPFGSDLKSEHYTEEGVQIIQLQNIGDGKFINENKIYTSEEKANQLISCNIYPGEIIIAKMADPVARACIIPRYRDRYLMASDGIRVVVDKDRYDTIFTLNYINSNYFRKKAIINSTGATRLRIGLSELKDLTLNVPSKEEQEKIASFFSLIDKKIEKQGEKVEALKDYKKGMMQKIFSKEIRFKDDNGRDYPEWKEKKLGYVIEIKSNRNKNNEVELVLSVSNTKGFIKQSDQFEDRVVASSDISNYKIVKKDDFAFNPARINVGSIARLKSYNEGVISPMYICFRCIDTLTYDYLEYFLRTNYFDKQMKNKLEGSVRQTLSADALCEILINLPCVDEQKR